MLIVDGRIAFTRGINISEVDASGLNGSALDSTQQTFPST
jgi:hypothetical protein